MPTLKEYKSELERELYEAKLELLRARNRVANAKANIRRSKNIVGLPDGELGKFVQMEDRATGFKSEARLSSLQPAPGPEHREFYADLLKLDRAHLMEHLGKIDPEIGLVVGSPEHIRWIAECVEREVYSTNG
jgi:hypothetical protein